MFFPGHFSCTMNGKFFLSSFLSTINIPYRFYSLSDLPPISRSVLFIGPLKEEGPTKNLFFARKSLFLFRCKYFLEILWRSCAKPELWLSLSFFLYTRLCFPKEPVNSRFGTFFLPSRGTNTFFFLCLFSREKWRGCFLPRRSSVLQKEP